MTSLVGMYEVASEWFCSREGIPWGSDVMFMNFYFLSLLLTIPFLQKKPKKTDLSFKRPEGMARELWGLLWTDNK